MSPEAFRCADSSEERDEPIFGTASFVRRWLMVEQPGPWGSDALSQSGLPLDISLELRSRARQAGVRPILIRRGREFTGDGRRCYLATTTAQETRLVSLQLDETEELLDIDLASFAQNGTHAGASEVSEMVVLVCTHGRHDACCAIRGNRVSRVVCSLGEVQGWECSHIGGDRFAANVVLFPHGIYYGRVNAEDVGTLIHDLGEGRVSIDHMRGRCSLPFPLQAAEHFVRQELGLVGLSDVRLVHSDKTEDGVRVRFAIPSGEATVGVAVGRHDQPQKLTCGALTTNPIPRYDLVSLNTTG